MAIIKIRTTMAAVMMRLRRRADDALLATVPAISGLAAVSALALTGPAGRVFSCSTRTIAGSAPGGAAGAAGRGGADGCPAALMMGPASMIGTSAGSQPGPQAWVHAPARATPKDSAVANRWAGSVASALITTAATGPGTPGAASPSGTGGS